MKTENCKTCFGSGEIYSFAENPMATPCETCQGSGKIVVEPAAEARIKPNELRVGNIVTDGVISPVKIESIEAVGIKGRYTQKDHGDGIRAFMYDQIDGVLISMDWLSSFGFKENTSGEWEIDIWSGTFLSVILSVFQNKVTVALCGELGTAHSCHLEYVHQLQNLYFSLTLTELTKNK